MERIPTVMNNSETAVTLQTPSFVFIRVIFVCNILVTGFVGITALFFTSKAPQLVF